MSDQPVHDRRSFEAQGSEFLRSNISASEYNYAANRPPHSFRLSGGAFTLAVRDSPDRIRHVFEDEKVHIQFLEGPRAGASHTVAYEAFEPAPDIFFIAFRATETESIAMAADLSTGAVTVVRGEMAEKGVISIVESARVEEVGPEAPVVYHPPFSLGGTRFLNTYADNVAYEHIYLTGVYETWLGVKGPQAGQADTEEYQAFKITDGVYLLYWNEGILTAQMTFLFNFLQGNCVAQVFARTDGTIVHNTIGAYTHMIHTKLAELPNVTRLDIYSGD